MINKQNDIIDKYLYIWNIFLLLFHTFLLCFFYKMDILLMARFNIFSVSMYAAGFLILRSDNKKIYIILTYFEIIIHMLLATMSIGLAFGFQFYAFALIAISFYIDYLNFKETSEMKFRLGKINIFVCILVLLFEVLYFRGSDPYYIVTDTQTQMLLTYLNILAAFLFLCFYMWIYSIKVMQGEKLLADEAQKDYLTEMHNRLYMMPKIEHLDMKKATYWIAILDIDNFKVINDHYGHDCGDYVLHKIARLIKSFSSEYDTCRWGGEEFLLLGRVVENEEVCFQMIDNLRKAIKNTDFYYDPHEISVTVTIGAAVYEESMSKNDWIRIADDCLYQGKQNGKNRVIFNNRDFD